MNNAQNPEWYISLYEKYQVQPLQGTAYIMPDGTCALGIACLEMGIEVNSSDLWIAELGEKLGLSRSFLQGVMNGFDRSIAISGLNDNHIEEPPYGFFKRNNLDDIEFRAGVELGVAVRQKVMLGGVSD